MDDEAIDEEFEMLCREYGDSQMLFDIPAKYIPTVKAIVKIILRQECEQQAIRDILYAEYKRAAEAGLQEIEHMMSQLRGLSEPELIHELSSFLSSHRDEELRVSRYPLNKRQVWREGDHLPLIE